MMLVTDQHLTSWCSVRSAGTKGTTAHQQALVATISGFLLDSAAQVHPAVAELIQQVGIVQRHSQHLQKQSTNWYGCMVSTEALGRPEMCDVVKKLLFAPSRDCHSLGDFCRS